MSALNQAHFQDADKAREYLEKIQWPNGPVCPHCGVVGGHYQLEGKAHRSGLWKCADCREQFTVTVGTVFERSKIKLNVWLQAVFLLCSSKKGMSAHQLHRTLGVTYKTAWFMAHRIREAFRDASPKVMGGQGGPVEIDETYNAGHYKRMDLAGTFAAHETVNHSAGEYARAGGIHSNTVEGYFGLLKRGIYGTYHHVSEAHLQRYINEFDFRFTNRTAAGVNDHERAIKALAQIQGKRLTYRRTVRQQEAQAD